MGVAERTRFELAKGGISTLDRFSIGCLCLQANLSVNLILNRNIRVPSIFESQTLLSKSQTS